MQVEGWSKQLQGAGFQHQPDGLRVGVGGGLEPADGAQRGSHPRGPGDRGRADAGGAGQRQGQDQRGSRGGGHHAQPARADPRYAHAPQQGDGETVGKQLHGGQELW